MSESCFNNAKLKALDGRVYEEVNHAGYKYRVIINNEDYDYVEDQAIIEELDTINYL